MFVLDSDLEDRVNRDCFYDENDKRPYEQKWMDAIKKVKAQEVLYVYCEEMCAKFTDKTLRKVLKQEMDFRKANDILSNPLAKRIEIKAASRSAFDFYRGYYFLYSHLVKVSPDSAERNYIVDMMKSNKMDFLRKMKQLSEKTGNHNDIWYVREIALVLAKRKDFKDEASQKILNRYIEETNYLKENQKNI